MWSKLKNSFSCRYFAIMAAGPISERNQDATIYVGGLDEKVTESLLWELFVQVFYSTLLSSLGLSNQLSQ